LGVPERATSVRASLAAGAIANRSAAISAGSRTRRSRPARC